jgi:hypothetical protein
MNQALYAHMNNKRKMKEKKINPALSSFPCFSNNLPCVSKKLINPPQEMKVKNHYMKTLSRFN